MVDWELYLTFPFLSRLALAGLGLYVIKYAIVFMVAGIEDFFFDESLLNDLVEEPTLLTRIIATVFGVGLCITGILFMVPLFLYTGAIF